MGLALSRSSWPCHGHFFHLRCLANRARPCRGFRCAGTAAAKESRPLAWQTVRRQGPSLPNFIVALRGPAGMRVSSSSKRRRAGFLEKYIEAAADVTVARGTKAGGNSQAARDEKRHSVLSGKRGP